MNGVFTRIVTGIVREAQSGNFVAAMVDDPDSEATPKDKICSWGKAEITELHKTDDVNNLALRGGGQELTKFWNTWPGDLEFSSRVVLGQLADGRWIVLAQACEE